MALVTKLWVNRRLGDTRPDLTHPRRLDFSGIGDYSDWAFGFSISGAVVTVNSGYIFHGMRAAVTVAGDVVTIVADNTYIYVNWTIGSVWTSIVSSTTFPANIGDELNWLLYKVTLTADVVSIGLGNIHHLGSIYIPGIFG